MPVKKKKAGAKKAVAAKKAAKKPAKKAVGRSVRIEAAKEAQPALKGFECEICGYRLVVDKDGGCAEEHVILCCGQPMKKFGENV